LPNAPVISVIDDDRSVRIATYRFLRSLGYVAHRFASAAEFLRSPYLNETSCVISDVQMPGISGVELQHLLNSQGRSMPIIFITAFPGEDIRSRAMKAGAVGFLRKPFDVAALIECINIALKQ
jgi:FixJ family two-component response regulator